MSLGLCLGLSGCIARDTSPDRHGDAVDVARAQRSWGDPWLAADSGTVSGVGYGSNGGVVRGGGARTWSVAQQPLAAARAEVIAAARRGWQLTSVDCAATAANRQQPSVVAHLQRPETDLDHAAAASVLARPGGAITSVTVTTQVPHHLDQSWPHDDPLDVASTCLGSGPSVQARSGVPDTPLPAAPGATSAPVKAVHGPAEWADDQPSPQLRRAIGLADADPWLTAMGLTLGPEPVRWRKGDNWRFLPSTTRRHGQLEPVNHDPLATVVAAAAQQGWTLSYAACAGPTGPFVAEVQRGLGNEHTATVRLLSDADSDGWAGFQQLVLSQPGITPAPTVATVTSPCWDFPSPPEGFTSQGTPHLAPTQLQPLAAGS